MKDFPELRRVFSGYLHEDFLAEYGSAEGAIAAFLADASDVEQQRFRREVRRFLSGAASLDLREVQRQVERLGSRWIPQTREAVVSLLSTGSRQD
ncbi:MAG TPA: contact-dependent growth inhibition system immunity protein [Vicinamibacterales bacterium]|jgi:hypothetical protein|nr:contact-dependent growth inhibition system immunity protein [Vicinamibacterales bacterium]